MSNITIFAAADYQYFFDHGIAFAKSANKAGHRCLLYIFPDLQKPQDEETKKLLLFMTNEFYKKVDHTMTEVKMLPQEVMRIFESGVDIIDRRALFASIRFMMLYDVLVSEEELTGNSVLVLDIDSVVNKPIKIHKRYDAGVFLREDQNLGENEYERLGMKVAAGALYVTMKSLPFVEKLSERMIKSSKKWFCDQIIIYLLYKEFKGTYTFMNFDNKFLDWEFENKKALVFTAKGDRKDSKKYLKIKEELSE